MINFDDIVLFDNKTFSDVLRDIYSNSVTKSSSIESVINQLKGLVKNSNDAILIIPLIRDYLDTSVKNDEQLIKMAAVIQRFFSGASKPTTNSDSTSLLTEQEKTELLKMANDISSTSIDNDLKKLNSSYEKLSK
ncbi:MAG TPA: hypothetical protein PLY35_08970 [Thermotogota bacterium]|nr:hypothetical protein [Thermotogota bacterium]